MSRRSEPSGLTQQRLIQALDHLGNESGGAAQPLDDTDGSLGLVAAAVNRLQTRLEDRERRHQADGRRVFEENELFHLWSHNLPGVFYRFQLGTDNKFRFVYISDNVDEIFGMPARDLLSAEGTQLFALFHPDDLPSIMDAIQVSAETGDRFQMVTRLFSDGRFRWVEFVARPERRPDGCVVWDGIAMDVTGRKSAEEARGIAEAQYRALVHNSPLGMHFYELREDGTLVFAGANPAADAILGASHDRLVGLSILEAFPGLRGSEIPERYRRAALEGVPWSSDQVHYEDGYLQGAFEVSAFQTTPKRMVAIFTEISSRIRSENELERNRRLLAETQSVARIGSYEYDIEQGTWDSTESLNEVFGIDESYVRTVESWAALIHPDDRADMVAYLQNEVLSRTFRFDREYRIVRVSDGQELWVQGNGIVIRAEDGRPTRMIGTIQDITRRKRAEHERSALELQLQQAQRLESIGRLAGGVAHDFNNMLTVILGYAEMLRYRDLDPDALKEVLEIEKAARHSRDVTAQLLAFSRKQVISPKPVNLNTLIQGSRAALSPLIGEDVEFVFVPGSDLWFVHVDPTQFEQILMNLAVNARDAMPKGGRIVIETSNQSLDDEYARTHLDAKPGEFVTLAFSDNGSGMEPEVVRRIFEPFFTTKAVGMGTGLGLSTVWGIVRQNGGFINVYSELGSGTTFRIYLPRFSGEAKSAPESGWECEIVPGGLGIVLVEDDTRVRELTEKMLTNGGYNVLVADNPQHALAMARDTGLSIDLLLTDVVMPGMGGEELSSRMRLLRPGLRTLFVSGYTPNAAIRNGLVGENSLFLQKPFSAKDLFRRIREVLTAPAAPDSKTPDKKP